MLDVVLTEHELRDEKRHDETLNLLKRANRSLPSITAGLFVVITSLIGVRLSLRNQDTDRSS